MIFFFTQNKGKYTKFFLYEDIYINRTTKITGWQTFFSPKKSHKVVHECKWKICQFVIFDWRKTIWISIFRRIATGGTSLLLAFKVNLFYYRKSRFSRHGLILTTTTKSQLTNKSKISTSSHQRIQETNINTTTIDILEKSSSHCSLIETSLNKR